MALPYSRQYRRIPGQFTNDDRIFICLTSSKIDPDSLSQLERLTHNKVQNFADADLFADFITDYVCKIFWITDDEFGKCTVPLLHDLPQIQFIYIFDENRSDGWIMSYSKVQGIFCSLESIENNIEKQIGKTEKELVTISVMNTIIHDRSSDNIDINKLEPIFMYSQLLKYIILDIDFSQREKNRRFAFLKSHYKENRATFDMIKKFEQKYSLDSFIYRDVNRALRLQQIELVWNFGFFIQDLHYQLKRLQANTRPEDRPKKVWRGQQFTHDEYEKLKRNLGRLMAFNNFLSTSTEPEIVRGLVQLYLEDPNLKAVLFEIDLESIAADGIPIHSPFASIKADSKMQAEDEVLFSMHAIFRISSINETNDGIGHIKLKLANDDDEELRAITEYLRQDIEQRPKGLHQLCKLMDQMGEIDTAIEIGQVLLVETPENNFKERCNIYNDLGRLCTPARRYTKALEYYTNMYNIICVHYPEPSENVLPRALIYANMARAIHLQGNEEHGPERTEKYKEALQYFEPFLDLESFIDIDDSSNDTLEACAINFNNIGLLYYDMEREDWPGVDDYSKTLAMFEKALSFYRTRPMPTVHPYIAILLNNIALIELNKMNTQNALKHLQDCLAMQERTLPPDHRSFANTYFNLSNCYLLQCMFDDAKQHAERAVQIARQRFDPNVSEYEELIHEIDFIQSKLSNCNATEYETLRGKVVNQIRSVKLHSIHHT